MPRPKSVEEALEIYYKKRKSVMADPAMTAQLITSNDGKSWTITDLTAP